MRWLFGALALTAVAAFATAAAAEGASDATLGDAEAGHALAADVCSACHAVEPGDSVNPVPEAPSFQSISKDTAMSEVALRAFLRSPHPTMPNLVMSQEEIEDISAYLAAMRGGD